MGETSRFLLNNIIPPQIVTQLKRDKGKDLDLSRAPILVNQRTSVVAMDIVGFTPLSNALEPHVLVSLLNSVFSELDTACLACGVEKICTIGDAFIACAGLFDSSADHALEACTIGLEMNRVTRSLNAKHEMEENAALPEVHVRVGIHSGRLYSGLVGGMSKFRYDVWGDTLAIAEVLEQSGRADMVHISGVTMEMIPKKHAAYSIEGSGKMVELPNGSHVDTFLLKPHFDAPALGVGIGLGVGSSSQSQSVKHSSLKSAASPEDLLIALKDSVRGQPVIADADESDLPAAVPGDDVDVPDLLKSAEA